MKERIEELELFRKWIDRKEGMKLTTAQIRAYINYRMKVLRGEK
jgi:hypothetical protein